MLGIANLDRATAACPIELFVAFSSVAGALGNVGQFDYAAANGYMDAYVEDRAARVLAGHARGRTHRDQLAAVGGRRDADRRREPRHVWPGPTRSSRCRRMKV